MCDYCIRQIDFHEVERIYNVHLIKHFPKSEIKPLKNIKRMWDEDNYFAYGMYDSAEHLLGYMFLCKSSKVNYVLLDYFAMTSAARGKGYGSEFLHFLSNELDACDGIIIETESVSLAGNEAQRLQRTSRNRFYERNGVVLTSLTTDTFSCIFDIWCLPCEGVVVEDEKIRDSLDKIYDVMIEDTKVKKERFRFL